MLSFFHHVRGYRMKIELSAMIHLHQANWLELWNSQLTPTTLHQQLTFNRLRCERA